MTAARHATMGLTQGDCLLDFNVIKPDIRMQVDILKAPHVINQRCRCRQARLWAHAGTRTRADKPVVVSKPMRSTEGDWVCLARFQVRGPSGS